MRRIAANYVFPVIGNPIRNGIVEVDDNGVIAKVYDFGGEMVELAHTEFLNGVLVPGLINMHTHLELSYMRREGDIGQGLPVFIDRMIKKSGSEEEREKITKALIYADEDMQRKGIVAVADISNSDVSIEVKKKSNIQYHTFIEISGLNDKSAEIRFNNGIKLVGLFQSYKLNCSLVPHAPYSIGGKLWGLLHGFYQRNSCTISIHNQESAEENKLFETGESLLKNVFIENNIPAGSIQRTQKTSLQSIAGYLASNKVLFVHNIFTDKEDIETIKKSFPNKCGFVICPSSNIFIENTLPPIDLLFQSEIPVMIGTDSLASGSSLSVFDELKLLQQKTDLTFDTLIRSATLEAANFMGWGHLGAFEKGKIPGVNLIQHFDFEHMRLSEKSRIKKIL